MELDPFDISTRCVEKFSIEKQMLKHKELYESLAKNIT